MAAAGVRPARSAASSSCGARSVPKTQGMRQRWRPVGRSAAYQSVSDSTACRRVSSSAELRRMGSKRIRTETSEAEVSSISGHPADSSQARSPSAARLAGSLKESAKLIRRPSMPAGRKVGKVMSLVQSRTQGHVRHRFGCRYYIHESLVQLSKTGTAAIRQGSGRQEAGRASRTW